MNSVFDVSSLIEIATFEGAFDLLQAGVMFVDHDCKIIHANRAARAMLGIADPIGARRAENAAAADDLGSQESGRNGGGAHDRPHEDRGSGLAIGRRPSLYPGATA